MQSVVALGICCLARDWFPEADTSSPSLPSHHRSTSTTIHWTLLSATWFSPSSMTSSGIKSTCGYCLGMGSRGGKSSREDRGLESQGLAHCTCLPDRGPERSRNLPEVAQQGSASARLCAPLPSVISPRSSHCSVSHLRCFLLPGPSVGPTMTSSPSPASPSSPTWSRWQR